MLKAKGTLKSNLFILCSIIALAVVGLFLFSRHNLTSSVITNISKPSDDSFKAPGREWSSPKKVEDYFVSNLHMTAQDAQDERSASKGINQTVMFRLTKDSTTEGLVSNLEYYGFVRDKNALIYALANSKDTLVGHPEALKFGNNTVDIWASYQISENMTAWELADQLLNHPTYFSYDQYSYMFMP